MLARPSRVATKEQSSGLTETNTAMRQLDQVTQQNAAMVEEATASCHDLTQETERLVTLTQSFQVTSATQTSSYRPYMAA